uniref:Uncharacterized protein n=1 Tax=Aegilops tauschii subsp. strangulata TaxID=200361 RepID=A0A453K2A4_AEGTS
MKLSLLNAADKIVQYLWREGDKRYLFPDCIRPADSEPPPHYLFTSGAKV